MLVAALILAGSVALTLNLGSKPAVGSNMGASMAGTAALAAGAALVSAVVAVAKGETGKWFQAGCIVAAVAACAFLSLPVLYLASGGA